MTENHGIVSIHHAIGLAILSFLVRFSFILHTDIAGDEPFSIFISQFDILRIVEYLSSGNNPPLFEVLLHYYMVLFGNSELVLRLFPTILSSLTVIPIFFIGSRFFNQRIALTASVMFVFAIQHIRFAHEVRVYSFLVFTAAWSLFFFLSFLSRPEEKRWWIGLIVCDILMIYSHFTAFYLLLAQFSVGVIALKRMYYKQLLIIMSMIAISYTPYIITFLLRLSDVSSSGTWVIKPGLGELYGSINLMLNHRWTTVFVLITMAIGFGISLKKIAWKTFVDQLRTKHNSLIVMLIFLIPYLIMFVVSYGFIPMFNDRYLLFNSVPLFLAVAILVDLAWQNTSYIWVGALLTMVGSIGTTNLNPSNNRNIASATQYVRLTKDPETKVFICPDHFRLAFLYHYERSLFFSMNTNMPEDPMHMVDDILNSRSIYPIRFLETKDLDSISKVIYFDADSKFVLPDNQNLKILNSKLSMVGHQHFDQIFDVYHLESTQN